MENGAQDTIAGYAQYLAYCKHTRTNPLLHNGSKIFKGIGYVLVRSMGVGTRFPMKNEAFFECDTHVINTNAPIIFGLDSMKKYCILKDEINEIAIHKNTGTVFPLVCKEGNFGESGMIKTFCLRDQNSKNLTADLLILLLRKCVSY